MSSAVNAFTKSPKILHITIRDFFTLIAFTLINKYGKGVGMQISLVFGTANQLACQKVFWNGNF